MKGCFLFVCVLCLFSGDEKNRESPCKVVKHAWIPLTFVNQAQQFDSTGWWNVEKKYNKNILKRHERNTEVLGDWEQKSVVLALQNECLELLFGDVTRTANTEGQSPRFFLDIFPFSIKMDQGYKILKPPFRPFSSHHRLHSRPLEHQRRTQPPDFHNASPEVPAPGMICGIPQPWFASRFFR